MIESGKFWNDLLFALRNQQCILALGSGIATGLSDEGQEQPLTELLANQLADQIERDNRPIEGNRNNLYQIASEFIRINGLTTLHRTTKEFYDQFKTPNTVQEQLAGLPFHLFFSAAPDTLIFNALERAEKLPKLFSYKTQGAERVKSYETIPKPTIQTPVVFNMLGSWQDPGSLVLTESSQLDYLLDIIRHQDAIPNTLLEICKTRKSTFVFAGFDFERWQLRLLLRALGLDHEAQIDHWAIQQQASLKRDTILFFKDEYGLQFLDTDTSQFVHQLVERFQQNSLPAAPPPPAKLRAVCLYAQEDQAFKTEFDAQLSPLREQQVETWDDAMIQPGQKTEEAFQKAIDEAQLIVLLASADFVESESLYQDQLLRAMERFHAKKAKIFPVIVRDFAWKDTLFGKLPIVLPQENGVVKPINEWAQRDKAYAGIVTLMQRHIKFLLDDLQKNSGQ